MIIIIINTDLTGKIQSWNSAAESSFGYSAKDILNMKLPLCKGENEEKFYMQLNEARKGTSVYNIDFKSDSEKETVQNKKFSKRDCRGAIEIGINRISRL